MLASTVQDLEVSLEFSYKEIAKLKKENADLKLVMGNLEMEDKRTQFQVKDVADKLDKIDSATKKRNLLFEYITETEGRREESAKVIGSVLDQLSLNQAIHFEACYRVGPFSKAKPRAILVTFERQGDRDLVYACRMELRLSNKGSTTGQVNMPCT